MAGTLRPACVVRNQQHRRCLCWFTLEWKCRCKGYDFHPRRSVNETTRTALNNLHSEDRELQNKAFHYVLDETDKPVDWAYGVWDEMVETLKHRDNHQRAIAAQVLCNLAKSDPKNRMLTDFSALLTVTRDERFVTARHCLQSLWKIGVAGKEQQNKLVNGLAGRFKECAAEKTAR